MITSYLRHRKDRNWCLLGLSCLAVAVASVAQAQTASGKPVGVVSHVKVLSDKVEDVSSIDDWKRSVIKEGMTDEQKALAVWDAVVKFRHQENPPHEFLQGEHAHIHDAIKTFNAYGYGQCCCASSNIQALARAVGLESRGRIISHHSVPEVQWGGKWHLLDASLICYFKNPDGSIASVDDLYASVADWDRNNTALDLNPPKEELEKLSQDEREAYLKQFDAKLDKVLRDQSRSEAFRQDGPELFKNSPFLGPRGWFPAKTHGWYSIVTCYDGRATGMMEYGYSQGYQVNVQLRPGERLIRNWSNKGLHVNQPERGDRPLSVVSGVVGKGDLVYAPLYADLAPGRVGNGTLEYQVPLSVSQLRASALVADNLADVAVTGTDSAVQAQNAARPGTIVLRMPSSYVYLAGQIQVDGIVNAGGRIDAEFSDNHGMDWRPLATFTQSGPQTIDLTRHVHRRYDYRLRFTLSGEGTGLRNLKLSHDIQHSQRALPALAQGSNTISFSAGGREGTITLEANPAKSDSAAAKNLVLADYHPQLVNIRQDTDLALSAGQGSITFPVSTPGDMTRIRMGSFYRTGGNGDAWEYQVSFDGGKTFKTLARTPDGPKGMSHYIVFDEVPANTREALVRYQGTKKDALLMHSFRIDADYLEPNGGFAPVKVTYMWEENGVQKQDERILSYPQGSYQITCETKPLMKSLIVELAE